MYLEALAACMYAGATQAHTVLLDEYWVPEILVNDVSATEVDTLLTGDATEAKSGEVSVRLENQTGWPSVRFRQAAMVQLDRVPLGEGETEARLWYRTDHWEGPWRLEVWAYFAAADPAPLKVLEADLDGGGEEGKLIADDQWHQAKGVVRPTDGYFLVAQDIPLVTFVWLVPTNSWNVAHRTYVDCVELVVTKGPLAEKPTPGPPKRVRGKPGAQTNGPGWIWFEGEDAAEHNFVPFGAIAPSNEDEQKLLSNGAWLESGDASPETFATWRINVPEAGRYVFWHRGNGTGFTWAWDDEGFRECTVDGDWTDEVRFQQHVAGGIVVHWIKLGDVDLTAGKHMLRVDGLPARAVFALDCWLLTQKPFTPHGADKPAANPPEGAPQ